MASPNVEATAESSVNTAGTSHTVTLPGGGSSTDYYLIIMDIGSTSATLNALTDWTESLDEAVANGLKIIRYTGTGVPSDPTFTSSASTRSASIAFRISGADRSVAPIIGTTATGTSATPNPPQVSAPSGTQDCLYIAFFGAAGEEADDDTWCDAAPTDYGPTPPLQKACGTAGTNLGGMIAAAHRQLTTSSVENPGTFTKDVSSAWRAQTLRIDPIPPVTKTFAIQYDVNELITVTARHSADNGTTSSQTLTTDSVTPTANSELFAFGGAESDGNAQHSVQTPTGGSLTYNQVLSDGQGADEIIWFGTGAFQLGGALYKAAVGGSPSAFSIVWDEYSGTNVGFYAAVACDVIGHNTTPVQSKTFGNTEGGGNSESIALTLDSTPTVDNTLLCFLLAGADGGGGFAVPNAGSGRDFTSVINQNNSFAQAGIFKRKVVSGDSATITCPDLGETVGNAIIMVVELEPETGNTPVAKTFAVQYDVQAVVNKAFVVQHDVRAVVREDFAVQHDIRSLIVKTFAVQYDIQASVRKDFAIQHDIQAAVLKTFAIQYDVLQNSTAVAKTFDIQYDVQAIVTEVFAIQHDVRAVVREDFAVQYDIQTIVTKAFGVVYDVRSRVAEVFALQHDVRSVVVEAFAVQHDVRANVTELFAVQYDVSLRVAKTFAIQYNVKTKVLESFAVQWDAQAVVIKTFAVQYDVIGVLAAVTKSIELQWDVNARVAESLELIWDITTLVREDFALLHDTRALARKDFTVFWDTLSNALPGESMGSIRDNKLAWLQQQLVSTSTDLNALEWQYYTGLSGLTPVEDYTLEDHKYAYFDAQVLQVDTDDTRMDLEIKFLQTQTGQTGTYQDLAALYYVPA